LWDRADPNNWGANAVVHHDGAFFQMHGALATRQPPQGRPVLVQAGQSGDGRDFAAKTAEAIFCPAPTFEVGKAFRDDIRARMAKFGRDADSVKVMPGLSFVLASTEAEAQAKDRELVELASVPLCIEYLSESVGVDLTQFDPTEPIPLAHILGITEFPAEDIRKMLEPAVNAGQSLGEFAKNYVRTPRGHHVFRGTSEQLADLMGRWLEGGACDGFTLQPAYMPAELEIFVDEVVPLLQRRGLLRTDYESATLRGHLGLPRP
jgi:alkanesulfonate monooxygenase SsuD/methylene tetrahydromethanopterin reductase-like flavin-dependent oxidoreductase (luciferase family)